MTWPEQVPVAVAKREFRRLLEAAEQGQRTVILKHGRPVAALGPVSGERPHLPVPRRPGGLLSLLGSFETWDTMESDMAEVIAMRRTSRDRTPPSFE